MLKTCFKRQKLTKEERIAKREESLHKRIWEIDLLRAVIIIGMFVDHLMISFWVNFPQLFKHTPAYFDSFFYKMSNTAAIYCGGTFRLTMRLLGVATLAVLIGINTQFSRSNLRRGLIVTALGIGMSLLFLLLHELGFANYVLFGAILCYGVCILIYTGISKLFSRYKKAWKWICLGIALFIFVGWSVFRSLVHTTSWESSQDNFFFWFNNNPSNIYTVAEIKSAKDFFHVVFGVWNFGDDWLGLFPYLGFVFLGSFIGQTVYKNKKSLLHFADRKEGMDLNYKFNKYTKPLLFFGHKTLYIYVFHQPVFFALAIIAGLIIGIPLAF